MLVLVNDQQHWLNRATEMRALADWIQAGETATIARRIARDYNSLFEPPHGAPWKKAMTP
jgi:hypothetical protein